MYAVIATGGKQYRVEKDGVLKIEKLSAEPGSTVEFTDVLLIADGDKITVGKPMLKGSKVLATVESHGQGRQGVDREVPAPQALSAHEESSAEVHPGAHHLDQRPDIRSS